MRRKDVNQVALLYDERSDKTVRAMQMGRNARESGQLSARTISLAIFFVFACATAPAAWSQSAPITITLAGQSMIRSDIRETSPAAVPVIQGFLKGDVIFTNLEAAIAEKGETTHEGRGFLAPPEALDALQAFGFNLISLSGNHAFDLKV